MLSGEAPTDQQAAASGAAPTQEPTPALTTIKLKDGRNVKGYFLPNGKFRIAQ
jgi:hypothetical protein